jgi:hypothetical protein
MEATLAHSIRYAVWGDIWTNSQQDDVIISIARFLHWQALSPGRKNPHRPFNDNNLHALLFIGLIPDFMFSNSYKEKLMGASNVPSQYSNAVNMAKFSAKALIRGFSKEERAAYNTFQKRYLDMYIRESQWRANHE